MEAAIAWIEEAEERMGELEEKIIELIIINYN